MRFILNSIAEAYELDPSIIDLVLWFPHLTWGQFMAAALAVLAWSWVSAQITRALSRATRQLARTFARPWLERLSKLPWCGFLNYVLLLPLFSKMKGQGKSQTQTLAFRDPDVMPTTRRQVFQRDTNDAYSLPSPYWSSAPGNLSRGRRRRVHHRYSSRPYAASSFPRPLRVGGTQRRDGKGCQAV